MFFDFKSFKFCCFLFFFLSLLLTISILSLLSSIAHVAFLSLQIVCTLDKHDVIWYLTFGVLVNIWARLFNWHFYVLTFSSYWNMADWLVDVRSRELAISLICIAFRWHFECVWICFKMVWLCRPIAYLSCLHVHVFIMNIFCMRIDFFCM